MDSLSKAKEFFMSKQGAKELITGFLKQFFDIYYTEARKDKIMLSKCIQQMFRKYYYSPLLPETTATPANLINNLVEREFTKDYVILPTIKGDFKSNKIHRLFMNITCIHKENHPMVADMELFLKKASNGIKMEAPGITDEQEYDHFKSSFMIFDRHYINIIGLIALEAGWLEASQTDDGVQGKTTAYALEDFYDLNQEHRLEKIIDNMIKLCSGAMSKSFPQYWNDLSENNMREMLRNPKKLDKLLERVLKKFKLPKGKMEEIISFFESGEEYIPTQEETNIAMELSQLQHMLDIYFFTPFGYYLQLIQPLYPDVYHMNREIDDLLVDTGNYVEVRNKLFALPISHDLTVLGEQILIGDKKPKRMQTIPKGIGDREILQIIMDNIQYLEECDEPDLFYEDDWQDDEYVDDMEDEASNVVRVDFSRGKNSQKKHGSTEASKISHSTDHKVYVFKAKLAHAKRIWRQIEIKGSDTLDDLHECIAASFNLEWGHLYSFFMSNKAWDPATEYCHAQAGGRPADKARISRLGLNMKQKFMYLYDYGDEQRFEIEVIEVKDGEKDTEYPKETKRNKPTVTECGGCGSSESPIEWYCHDHELFLCSNCADSAEHKDCYIVNANI